MALYKLTGINTTQGVEVDSKRAERNFLIMVNMNLFSLRDLLTQNPQVTNGSFKQWYLSRGYDFSNLLNILNSH
jgi:hypothetical protein